MPSKKWKPTPPPQAVIDMASEPDRTCFYVKQDGHNRGNTNWVAMAIERALDEGKTIFIASTGEMRGADLAKDVTPKGNRRGA